MAVAVEPVGAPVRVVLLGPPGSGKGTQAELLAGRFGVPAVSTGEMLREAVANGNSLGRRVEETMLAGRLVDDATMAEVVGQRLAKPDALNGFLLDGYPRTVAQAEDLDRILDGRRLDAVVLVEVPEPVLVERSLARGREDDTAEVIRERLRVYGKKTEPLVGYYQDRGLLHRVDGDQLIEAVNGSIVSVLED